MPAAQVQVIRCDLPLFLRQGEIPSCSQAQVMRKQRRIEQERRSSHSVHCDRDRNLDISWQNKTHVVRNTLRHPPTLFAQSPTRVEHEACAGVREPIQQLWKFVCRTHTELSGVTLWCDEICIAAGKFGDISLHG